MARSHGAIAWTMTIFLCSVRYAAACARAGQGSRPRAQLCDPERIVADMNPVLASTRCHDGGSWAGWGDDGEKSTAYVNFRAMTDATVRSREIGCWRQPCVG